MTESATLAPQTECAPPVQYSNRFGALTLMPVTEFMPIKNIRKSHPQAKANAVDFETAEKIALITENRRIQICFMYPEMVQAYVVLHNSPSTAAYCRVTLEKFECNMSPADMLNDLNRQTSAYRY